ncbi:hypothetical protein JXA80_10595 [bacterium]|nr:hypothetical protein [candidate division CSSED10-310 bacterium]
MLDRFSETAKRLITLARERAEERRHSSLTNEHLLEVFLESSDCFAYRILMEQCPCIEFINRELTHRLSHVNQDGQGGINFDDACKKTFERVFLLTEKLNHKGISTGSLILGMLQAECPRTAPLLRAWGLSLKGVLNALTTAGDPGPDETLMSVLPADVAVQINRMTEWSEDVVRIVAHSQELAKSCNSAQVIAHHFLLSLVFLASRGVVDVDPLDASSFDLARVKESVTPYLKSEMPFSEDHLVFDNALHRAFRFAGLETFQFGKNSITALEIALGLLQVIPDEANSGLGGDYFSLRWRIIDQLGPASPGDTARNRTVPDMLVPRISLRRYNADQSTVILIPEKLAREWQVMALDSRDNTVTVAMVDPFNRDVISKIEELTGMSVAVIKADAKDLHAAFRINY